MTGQPDPAMTGPPVAVGDVLTLAVERVAPGGHCVAHHEGRVVFVRHALPGERVRGTVTEVRPAYLRADATAVESASPDRVEAPCPYAGPGRCGGCDWQHATPAAQRALKAEVVTELLTRLGGMAPDDVAALDITVDALPGGPLDWRTRVRYAVDRDGRAGFRAHRSHRVVPVRSCAIATPAVRELPVTDRRWPPGSEIVAAASGSGDSAVLRAAPRSARGRRSRPGPARLVTGTAELTERVGDRDLAVPADAFWQVHPAAPGALADIALELLAPRAGERVLDLYGGVGLFAAALAGAGAAVTLVESGRDAVAAARRNLTGLGVRTVAARVEDVLADLLADGLDAVLLDPPRSGAGRDVVAALAAARPRAICYVACDPAALARDTRTFAGAGWHLAALRAVDAFPMTHHVECVALFEPLGGGAGRDAPTTGIQGSARGVGVPRVSGCDRLDQ